MSMNGTRIGEIYLSQVRKRLASQFGPVIMQALGDPQVNEIMLNQDGRIYVERAGALRPAGELEPSMSTAVIRTVASVVGQPLRAEHPVVSGELPFDGARFEGLLPPLCRGPVFSIRCHNAHQDSLQSLGERGFMSAAQQSVLSEALLSRKSLLIAGGTGCGKTTLARALLREVGRLSPRERLITIEDTPELGACVDNQVNLYASAEVSMCTLLRSTLRLRPDRIVVGEVRGAEALDLIDALCTGHRGGLATVHAGSAAGALRRMALLVSRHPQAPRVIEPLVAEAFDLVITLGREPVRRVLDITAISGVEQGRFILQTLGESAG